MLWTIVVLLLILWLLGFTLHVAGGLIHILLVIALVVIVIQLLTGRVPAGHPAAQRPRGDQGAAGPPSARLSGGPRGGLGAGP